ncbi:MAG: hypothetical protein WAT37_14810 [Saprospiraceae bacterium]
MKILFISLVLYMCSIEIYSQSIFFKESESGFHISGQFASADGATILGILPGYTSKGKLTFGLGLVLEKNTGLDINIAGVRSFISYLAIKQNDNSSPVSVNLGAAWLYNSFSGFDRITANRLDIGAEIYHQITAGNNFVLIPGGSVGWSSSNVNYKRLSESKSGISYGLSLSGKFDKFYVTPSLSFSKGNSRFNLIFGIIFPK